MIQGKEKGGENSKLFKELFDAASGKIPILSDSSVEEASPVSFLSFPGKKEMKKRQEFCVKSLRVILLERAARKRKNVFSQLLFLCFHIEIVSDSWYD